jgi:hypothetical protein
MIYKRGRIYWVRWESHGKRHDESTRETDLTKAREVERLRPVWVERIADETIPAILHVPAEGAKWGHPRDIPLVPEALAIIERRAPFGPHKIHVALARASKLACLAGPLTFRDLRTYFLTCAARLDPVAAQWLGGHQDLSTTSLYARSDAGRARAAVLAAAKGREP